jgi:PPOX class probable F420-dependent enzyme
MADAAEVYRARPTDAEIDEVLAQRVVATVGTLNADGSIHLAYVIFLHHEGRVYFETASLTRKARNAERAGRASVLVQGHASSGRSLMVSFEGTARVLRGPAAQELNHLLRAKYIQPGALPDVDRAWGRLDDVAVEVTPEKRRSWCGATLHEETQRELSMPYGEIWLEG